MDAKQADTLARELAARIESGERRFLLVGPPGAGKTTRRAIRTVHRYGCATRVKPGDRGPWRGLGRAS